MVLCTPINRLILRLLVLTGVVLFCSVPIQAQSPVQTFQFDYDGPDTLYADSNCIAILDWGHPDEPTCTVSGPGLFLVDFSIWMISDGYQIGDSVPAGEVVDVTYRALDNMGNMEFFPFSLPVVDTISPQFTDTSLPPDTIVSCDNYPDTASVQFTDNCSPNSTTLAYTEHPPDGFCSPDSLLRTWTITDTFGNQSQYTQVIQISPDTSAPVIDSMPISSTASCDNWEVQYDAWLFDQRSRFSAFDVGCGGVTLSDDGMSASILGDTCGLIEVTFTAEDSCGNQSSVQATFEILDDQPPALLEPAQNDTFYCDDNNAFDAFQQWLDDNGGAEAFDSCSAVHWSTIPANPLLNISCDSLTEITFVADDGCGHSVSSTAEFLFRDTVAPDVIEPARDSVVFCSEGSPDSLFLEWAMNGAYPELTDLCTPEEGYDISWYIDGQPLDSGELLSMFQDSLEGACRNSVVLNGDTLDQVKAMVRLEFGYSDLCGNESRSEASFVLRDTSAPSWLNSPMSVTLDCDSINNPESALEDWYFNAGGGTVMDACDTALIQTQRTLSEIKTAFQLSQDTSCGQSGQVNVTFYAADRCGNQTQMHSVSFSIIDTIRPQWITEPQSDTIFCSQELDSTLMHWLDQAGMSIISDACDTATLDSFSWVSSYGTTGIGQRGVGPYPNVPDSLCSGSIEATFYISDACGNQSSRTASFHVQDTSAPVVTGLADTMTVNCQNVPDPGQASIIDYCSTVLNISSTDSSTRVSDSLQCGYYQYTIYRTYTAEDVCGNTLEQINVIHVVDETAPTLSVPPDRTISCTDLDSLDEMAQAEDLCGPVDTLYYEDVMENSGCEQIVYRIWTAADICGNTSVDTQEMLLIDDVAPVVSEQAEDLVLSCTVRDSMEAKFDLWVQSAAGAQVSDQCSDVAWFAAFPGTYQIDDTSTYPQSFPEWPDSLDCPPADINGFQLNVVFYDPCGNAVELDAKVLVIDTVAPSISFPDTAGTEYTEQTSCGVDWVVDHPNIYDACNADLMQLELRDTTLVTSEMPGDGETVVNSEVLTFTPPDLGGQFPGDGGLLEIELFKVDAEGRYEHYRVLGEDGTFLGLTDSLMIQCGTGSTSFPLTSDQVYDWYRDDGQIDIHLQPLDSDTLEARYFINDICPGASIRGSLSFQTAPPSELSLEYSVDSLPFVPLKADGSQKDTVFLDVGSHDIRYRIQDCAGNTRIVNRNITVADTVAPSIVCPQDTVIQLAQDSCQWPVALSLPDNFSDNCGPVPFDVTSPNALEDKWLTFSLDPNTNDYIADAKTLVFQSVQANALGPVQLELQIRGNVNEERAYFIVIGEQNDTLGTTAIDQSNVDSGSCDIPLIAQFEIEEQTFNDWASDGALEITLKPNRQFMPPPGGMGDGINPCDRSLVQEDGDIDSVSRVQAAISGFSWELNYAVSGATTVPPTTLTDPDYVPLETLQAGINTVTWTAEDASGNATVCQYEIELRDTVPPTAVCKDVVLRIPPTGNTDVTLNPSRIDDGSFDNCEISSRQVRPNTFNCDQVGEVIPVEYIVEDEFGTTDTCQAEIRVERMVLEPSYFLDICDPDTLFLLANLPDTIDPDVLTFEWTGPNGFQSQLQNPVIPNASGDFSGTYQVRATGLNGCYAEGTIDVVVEMLETPEIETQTPLICEGEQIQLSTTGYTGDVTYQWYRGTPPNGVLLGSTVAPSFELSTSPPEGNYSYYVVIETPTCSSNPSNAVNVEVITSPMAQINAPIQVLCEGEALSFSSMSNPLFEFEWSGPNSFTSDLRNPSVTDSVSELHEGMYSLVVSLGNCVSQPATAEVIVNPSPAQPVVQAPAVVCAGNPLTLTVTNVTDGDTYRWVHPDGSMITNQNPSLSIQNATVQEAGVWQVEVVKENCPSPMSDSIFIGVEDITYFSADNDGPACEGDSVLIESDAIDGADYQWTGPNGFNRDTSSFSIPAEEGVYQVTVTTQNGCTETASTTVEVKTKPEITGIESQGIICSDGEVDVCFNISVFPPDEGQYQYQWEGPNNFFSDEAEPCIDNAGDSDNGVYTLTVLQDGCASKAVSTILNVIDVSSVPPLLGETDYCAGDSIVLETDPYTGFDAIYVWNTPKGQRTTDEPRLIIPSAEVDDAGVYEVFLQVEDCETERSAPLEISVTERPVRPEVDGTTSICAMDTVQLEVDLPQPGLTYEWVGPQGTVHTGQSWTRFPAADSMEGDYRVRAVRGQCVSMPSDPIFVQVTAIPQVPEIESYPEAICRNMPGQTPICIDPNSATSGARYEWVHVETGEVLQAGDGLCYIPQSLPPGLQNIYVRAEHLGCRSSLSVPVTIRVDTIPDVTADAGMDDVFCPGSVNRLQAVEPAAAEGMWKALNSDALVLDPMNPASEVVDVPVGVASYVWSLSNGACMNFSRDTVYYKLPSSYNARNDAYAGMPGASISLRPEVNDLITTDSFDIQVIDPPQDGQLQVGSLPWDYQPDGGFIGRDSAVYEICSRECPSLCDTAVITFRVGDESSCTVPTIFTPNNDGINDRLVIPCLSGPENADNTLIIFNQWGDEIYRASPYENDWNGTYKGEQLPAGTYFYTLTIEGKQLRTSGFIVIER